MNWVKKLDHPFPFYCNDDRKNLVFVTWVSGFVFVFMILFKTSRENHLELNLAQKAIFSGVTFLSLGFSILILPRLFSHLFDPVHWTIRKYILHTLFNIILIGTISTAVDELYICPERSLWENFKGANEQVVMIGAIPISLISLFLRNSMLKENLKHAMSGNLELEKIKNLKGTSSAGRASGQPITLRSDTSETLTINLRELLFIQAGSNYSTFFLKNGVGIQKKLLRINLKSLDQQINNPYAIRCHRSFIVNINAISSITGNTNGYKLQIQDTDHFIPVSRHKGRDIIEKIQQIRNIMELS
jgi:hypothetical protein